jgi:hypothetical protein
MILDLASDTEKAFWGFRTYGGIDFYIEPDTRLDDICPFSKPEKLLCPHKGLCKDNYVHWEHLKYIEDDTFGYKKLADLIPDSLIVNQGLTFVNATMPQSVGLLKKMFAMTNAVPVMIYGLKPSMDYKRIFDMARASMIRPVYISGSSMIPVPKDFR